jgi:hypothetical protein
VQGAVGRLSRRVTDSLDSQSARLDSMEYDMTRQMTELTAKLDRVERDMSARLEKDSQESLGEQ